MSAKYTTVMLPDGRTFFKSFGWARLDDSSSVDWCAMNDWHTELVKEVGIDPETGRKTIYTYKPTEKYVDSETGKCVISKIGKYDAATAAEYHRIAPGDMVVVEHDGTPFVKIWRCSSDHCGSPRQGVRCSGRGNLTGFVR